MKPISDITVVIYRHESGGFPQVAPVEYISSSLWRYEDIKLLLVTNRDTTLHSDRYAGEIRSKEPFSGLIVYI